MSVVVEARMNSPRTSGLETPLVLMLALTNACNLNCRHCYREEAEKFEDELQPAEIFSLLDAFAQLCRAERRTGAIVFSGGEPLLYPHLGLALRVARDCGLLTRVNTNATLATPHVATELAGWGLQVAQVSVDGPSLALHESVRGKGTWNLTRRGVQNLQAANIAVELKVTLIKGHNDADPAAYVQLAREWGGAAISFARLIPIGSGRHLTAYDAASYRAVLDRLAGGARDLIATELAAEIRDATFDRTYALGVKHRHIGEEAQSILAIDADGTCLVSRRMPVVLGNIRQRSLGELWHHPLLERIRSAAPQGKCQHCDLAGVCGGGSRAAAWAQLDDILAPDPACWVEPESGEASP